MTHSRTVRVRHACAPLVLGLAVLLWGTGYKLSLYSRHQSATLSAKLLSENERPQKLSILAAARSIKAPLPAHSLLAHHDIASALPQVGWPCARMLAERTAAKLRYQLRTSSLRAPPVHS